MDNPAPPALRGIADDLGIGISATDWSTYEGAATGLLASWTTVDELYRENAAPTPPQREWADGSGHPLGAWYVTTELQTRTEGPLAGRTVAVKDNIAVAGVPMMNGSDTVRGFTPSRDATVVTRLLEAGAVIKGKSACEDLCFSGASHTNVVAPIRNPWDPSRSAGGSSSGSGALVASGEVDLALGGDQGGSIRIPASFCGVVGHKPTFGLVPYTGAFPIEQTIDHVGPIAATVADAAAMLSVLAGADGLDPRQPTDVRGTDYVAELALQRPLRFGVVREGFGLPNADPGVNSVVRAAVEQLTAAGHSAVEVSVPWHRHGAAIWDVISVEGATWQMLHGNAYGRNWKGLYDPELIEHYGRRWRADPASFSETVKLVAVAGEHGLRHGYGTAYAKARNLEPVLTAAYDAALAEVDVLVMPTTPITASAIPAPGAAPAEVIGSALDMVANTAPLDVTGHPACSVPVGLSEGLPVGMMIIGKLFDDAGVLRAAQAVEAVVGTLRPAAGELVGA